MIHFDLDLDRLRLVGEELSASPTQFRLALSRSLARTAQRLRTLSSRGLRDELQLKLVNELRNRLKSIKIKSSGEGVVLWYGLNDMPVSWFRGTPRQDKSGSSFRGNEYRGAFVAKGPHVKSKTVFKREGTKRLHIREQLVPISDQAQVYIEDRIFPELEDIFWPIFERELRARVRYNIGKS